MVRFRTRRYVALTAVLTLVSAQPAVLCGLSCLALHTPAESLAQHHHGAPDAPCTGGVVAAADQIPVDIQPVGVAVPSWIAVTLPPLRLGESGSEPRSEAAFPVYPDNPDPPPRA